LHTAVLAAFASAGALRMAVQAAPGPHDVSRYADAGYIQVTGRLISEPYVTRGASFILRAEAVRRPDGMVVPCTGSLFCTIALNEERTVPRYGDVVTIAGTIMRADSVASPGFTKMDAHVRRHGTFAFMRVHHPSQWRMEPTQPGWNPVRFVLGWRDSMFSTLQRHLPRNTAALATGIVFGGRNGMSAADVDAFTQSGLVHIIAASGANVAIFMGLAYWVTRRLHLARRTAALVSAGAVAVYAVAAGAEPSVMRAATMAVTFLAAPLLDRDGDGPSALALAGLASLMWDPGHLWDVGFQLSFAIVAVFIAFWPVLSVLSWADDRQDEGTQPLLNRLPHTAWRLTASTVTLSALAGLAAAPITAQVFNAIPTVGILSNALAGPAVAVLLPAALLAWLAGLITPTAGGFLCHTVVGPLANFVSDIAHWSGGLPGAVLSVPSPGWPAVALCYASLAAVAVMLVNKVES
jgi:competence protein ComEC